MATIDDTRAAHIAAVRLRQAETDALIDRGLALAAAINATDSSAPGHAELCREYRENGHLAAALADRWAGR